MGALLRPRHAGAALLDHPRAVPLLATRPVDTEVGMGTVAGVLDRFGAAEFYDHWFATGLEAMILGLGQQLAR